MVEVSIGGQQDDREREYGGGVEVKGEREKRRMIRQKTRRLGLGAVGLNVK